MKLVEKFFEITFEDEKSKTAYLNACKWLATSVYGNKDMENVTVSIIKIKDAKVPTFKVMLYAMLDNDTFESYFCDKCQTIHRSFFINENCNCNECKLTAYRNQRRDKLKIVQDYKLKLINFKNKKDEHLS